ncbi:hypothetical protein GCK72_021014 [Caenorhabditis remanei]|uniref:Uncharacterized protein n=1 Tax=Caenorhabditis remanei TaxID=31234 RepID=A0A6A5GIM8_CAERE|nr:hypothetical protein GCK72_021014 [Caenorhabditis remanei]KAF1754451.1 hypothetical protein GCK72_021014 [Caenorhabditis remanei]
MSSINKREEPSKTVRPALPHGRSLRFSFDDAPENSLVEDRKRAKPKFSARAVHIQAATPLPWENLGRDIFRESITSTRHRTPSKFAPCKLSRISTPTRHVRSLRAGLTLKKKENSSQGKTSAKRRLRVVSPSDSSDSDGGSSSPVRNSSGKFLEKSWERKPSFQCSISPIRRRKRTRSLRSFEFESKRNEPSTSGVPERFLESIPHSVDTDTTNRLRESTPKFSGYRTPRLEEFSYEQPLRSPSHRFYGNIEVVRPPETSGESSATIKHLESHSAPSIPKESATNEVAIEQSQPPPEKSPRNHKLSEMSSGFFEMSSNDSDNQSSPDAQQNSERQETIPEFVEPATVKSEPVEEEDNQNVQEEATTTQNSLSNCKVFSSEVFYATITNCTIERSTLVGCKIFDEPCPP